MTLTIGSINIDIGWIVTAYVFFSFGWAIGLLCFFVQVVYYMVKEFSSLEKQETLSRDPSESEKSHTIFKQLKERQ